MIKTRFLVFSLLLLSSVSEAATSYITDVLYVNMRSGPGNEFAPVKTLKSGKAVTVAEPREKDNGFILVHTANGEKGWVPAKYLQEKPVARDIVSSSASRISELLNVNTALTSEIAGLKQEIARVQTIAEQGKALQQENVQLRQARENAQTKVISIQEEMAGQAASEQRKWFMLGAGAILFGILLGLLIPKLRNGRRNIFL